jgi:hypothetical protein
MDVPPKELNMRSRLPSLALACMTLAACGPGGPPAPPGLAYGLPTQTAVTYTTEARADIDIDAEGQSMQAQGSSSMTLDVAFAESSDGLGVTMEVPGHPEQPHGVPVGR